jgi:signal transduction histidine kinase
VLVNVASVAGLLEYARRETRFLVAERDAAQETARLKESLGRRALQSEIDLAFAGLDVERLRPAELLLTIRNLDVFARESFARQVDKAVILHRGPSGLRPTFFNLPRRFIFDRDDLDREEAAAMVEQSLDRGEIVERAGRIAGPILVQGQPWGGFYLALRPAVAAAPDPALFPIGRYLLLLLPGAVFLLWFLWGILNRGVLRPLDEVALVAQAVMSGDFTKRVPSVGEGTEFARVAALINRMLDLVQEYREHMEAKVAEKTREIETKNRELALGQRLAALGTLAAGVAHEINNPLGGMLNAAARLRRADLAPEQHQRCVAIVEETARRIQSIVERLLAVSPRRTQPGPVAVPDEIRRAVELVQHRAGENGIAIEVRCDPGVPPVLGEAHEIGQILLNLLLNALDAGKPGGRIRIEAGSEGDPEGVEIRVADDGGGMTPEVAARAFDHFFTTKEAGRGTGLGLAMVRSLVEALGGSIRFESEPGAGTVFHLRFQAFRPPPVP